MIRSFAFVTATASLTLCAGLAAPAWAEPTPQISEVAAAPIVAAPETVPAPAPTLVAVVSDPGPAPAETGSTLRPVPKISREAARARAFFWLIPGFPGYQPPQPAQRTVTTVVPAHPDWSRTIVMGVGF